MASEEALRRLAKLSPREREVLTLLCAGVEGYKAIGEKLFLSENTIKTYMARVYTTLELAHVRSAKTRLKVLDEVYCPALQELTASRALQPVEPQPTVPEHEVEIVSDDVMEKVDEDEKLLVLYRRPKPPAVIQQMPERGPDQVIVLPPEPRRTRWLIGGVVIGVFVGMLALAGAYFLYQSLFGVTPTAVAQVTPLPTSAPIIITQPVTVVVSPTPAPATSTPPQESTQTDTLVPSPTVVPSSTPIPDTPAGSVLEVGQTWRQGGVALTLLEFVLHPAREDFYGQLYVSWRFTNSTAHDIILSFTADNFSAQDNFGNRLKTLRFYNESFWCDGDSVVVRAGETFSLGDMCGPGSSGYQLPIVVNLSNQQLTEVMVTASAISSIDRAQWRIPIFH